MWSLVIDCSSILSIVFYSIKYTKYCIKSQYIFLFSQLIHIVKYITWEDSSGLLGFFSNIWPIISTPNHFRYQLFHQKNIKKNAVLLKHRNGTKNPKRSPICTPPLNKNTLKSWIYRRCMPNVSKAKRSHYLCSSSEWIMKLCWCYIYLC